MRELQTRQRDGRVITVFDFTDEIPEPEEKEGVVVPFKPKEPRKK